MRRDNVIDDQRTRRVSVDELAVDNARVRAWQVVDVGAEMHMFTEDVQHGILPYSKTNEMSIRLEPEDESTYRLVASALGRDGHSVRYHRFEDAVPDFIRECAQTIMRAGMAQYEIVTERDAETLDPLGFRLQWVMPHTIRRRRGRWVQDVGRKAAARFGTGRFLPVDVSRIMRFPVVLPLTARKLLEIHRTLAGVGTGLVPMFALNPAEEPPEFNFGDFQRGRSRAMAAATASVGWNARGLFGDEITDYYYLVREIRFQRFLLRLRSSIIDGVNRVLAAVLPSLGRRGQVVLSGFPGAVEIEMIERNLARGTDLRTAFKEIAKV